MRKVFKAAAYIRVSTEEQAENPEGSIKNQEERLRDYIKLKNHDGTFAEIKEVFCDPGVSAKDMNRPALQRLLAKIRSGEIDLVLVTELSRLTRSTKDFAILWDFMREHGCQFQSLRDNFDTTSPAGEMILFTLANFAQFERKQLGERISNSFQARAKRGLWNGGVLPLGFDLDKDKPGHLKIIPEQAEIVKEVFKTFLKEETISLTGKSLNDRSIKLPRHMKMGGSVRHSHFTVGNVHGILTNKSYIGIRVYKTKTGKQESKGMWDPIIDEVTFNRVQSILKNNKSRKKPASKKRYPYFLSGITYCAKCGDRMAGKSAHGNGGKIAYYEHCWSMKTQSCLSKKVFQCEPKRVLAKKLEPVVWDDVKRFLTDPEFSKQIFNEVKSLRADLTGKKEITKIKAKISSIKDQIEATTERVAELPKEIDAKVFYDQIAKLQTSGKELEIRLRDLENENFESESPISFDDFTQFTTELRKLVGKTTDPEVKASICRKLIHRIEISVSGVKIHYYVGDRYYESELKRSEVGVVENGGSGSRISTAGSKAKPSRPLAKFSKNKSEEKNLDQGSNTLTNGRPTRTRTSDPPVMSRML